ncbi:hypothetical protein [Spirosoma arcticum]
MPYSDFTLEKIQERFGINNRLQSLFDDITPVVASERLIADLDETHEILLRSEKAKSEWIVVPVLKEIKRRNNPFLTIHSGENLDADVAAGLDGECDFILAKDTCSYSINFPVIQVVEAKKQDFDIGISQCAAQLIGADLFNKKRGVVLDKIYGCVTTGANWQFLVYEANTIYIDPKLYAVTDVDQVLGVFQYIVDYYKTTLD